MTQASEATTPETKAPAVKPAEVTPPPFSVDVLQGSTSKFTRKGWDVFQSMKSDLQRIQEVPVLFTLEARSPQDIEPLKALLTDSGVEKLSHQGHYLAGHATLATIQTWIRSSFIRQCDLKLLV
ncbi:MAG: hypothetical protein ACKO37_06935 [Vampirovibrionales bacterium]